MKVILSEMAVLYTYLAALLVALSGRMFRGWRGIFGMRGKFPWGVRPVMLTIAYFGLYGG
jgi:hypothetical protein